MQHSTRPILPQQEVLESLMAQAERLLIAHTQHEVGSFCIDWRNKIYLAINHSTAKLALRVGRLEILLAPGQRLLYTEADGVLACSPAVTQMIGFAIACPALWTAYDLLETFTAATIATASWVGGLYSLERVEDEVLI